MSSISSALSSLLSSSSNPASNYDLSSILEAALGASSPGLDVTAAVNSAVTAAQAPEQAWENQLSTLQNQSTAINQLQTDVSNLDNDVQGLNSITGPLSAMTVSSSNSGVVTAAAAPGSTAGNHVVVVNNLATTASWTSGAFANGTTALPAGSFTITTGTGATTITTDGTQTLNDVVSQINGDNLGLTASVVTDATGSRLAIVANNSGSAGSFTVSGSASFGFTVGATGANASLTVDGISIQSASNTVTGAVPGLTLNLQSASPGTQISLNVQPDTSGAASAINQFVSDYNTVISFLNTQFTYTSGSGQGVLATDSTVRSLQSAVLGAISYTNTAGSSGTVIPNLTALGISVNNDGTLNVDSSNLQSTLQNNFSGVQSFFQGASLNGFANSLDQTLTSFIDPSNGAFTLDLQSISGQETDLNTDITNFETNYITPLKAQLQSEYSQAEILLQQLPTEMKQIQAELGQNSSSNG
jgi:flagellar hook-associated protein 2